MKIYLQILVNISETTTCEKCAFVNVIHGVKYFCGLTRDLISLKDFPKNCPLNCEEEYFKYKNIEIIRSK